MPDSQPRAESSPLNFLDSFEGIGMTEILRREDSAVGDSNKSKQRSEKAYPAPRPVTPSERWIGDRYFSPITPSEHWIENPYPSPVIPFELFREKRGIEEDRDVKFKEARIPKRLLKYKADVENGLTLRDVLCQRTTPQCVSEAPMTMEQLKEAARLRQRDRERAIMVLEGMDSDSFTGEDAWISEFLNTEGNSVTQLAQLLVDAKYDSPFILRPGYFQRIFSRFESVEPDNSQHITRFLPKKLFSKRFGKGNRRGEVRSPLSINEAREALPPDLMLGLAGFNPMVRTGLDYLVRHESWLEDISRHLVIDSDDDSKISVAYGKRRSLYQTEDPCALAQQTLSSITALRQAIMELHELKLCPENLPILIKIQEDASTDVVEVVDINLSDITILWRVLSNFVKGLEGKYPKQRGGEQARRGGYRLTDLLLSTIPVNWFTISFLVGTLIIFPVAILAVAVMACYPPFFGVFAHLLNAHPIQRNHHLPDIDAAMYELIGTVNTIFGQFKSKSIPGGTRYLLGKFRYRNGEKYFFGDDINDFSFDSEQQVLHYTALCSQIVCLALQSFAQAHTGELQLSFLDRGISRIQLTGGGLPFKNVVAYLQMLTCFGEMTKSPVLVFQTFEPSESLSSKELGEKPCDIISSLQDIACIWGSARYNYIDDSEAGAVVNDITYVHGGVLHPAQTTKIMDLRQNSLTELWHWTSETDPQLPRILESMKKLPVQRSKVRIGAPKVNKFCPLSSDENQKLLRRIAQDHLDAMEAFAPHWELNTLQGGLQGGQWVVPQMMVGWQKLPGRTRKQGILDPGNCLLIPELCKYWGLQLSLCTGVLWRVPLQKVIATCIEQYMANRIPQMPEWRVLRKTHRMVDMLYGCELALWFQQLPDQYQLPASTIIKEILHRLQHTGVDNENMLRIGWARLENGLECLKIPCTRDNYWAKMLADSTETVTFACVTEKCLETTGRVRTCGNTRPSTFDRHRPLQLCTQVRPRGVDYNSRVTSDQWKIRDGKSYWMGRDDLMLLANVAIEKKTPILRVKRSSMPIPLFKRMNTRATVRETNDDGAVDCIVVTDNT